MRIASLESSPHMSSQEDVVWLHIASINVDEQSTHKIGAFWLPLLQDWTTHECPPHSTAVLLNVVAVCVIRATMLSTAEALEQVAFNTSPKSSSVSCVRG